MRLVICEKPSVAKSISAALGANERGDGYLSGGGYIVSWCFGHLVELAQADAYNESYGKQYRYCHTAENLFNPHKFPPTVIVIFVSEHLKKRLNNHLRFVNGIFI